MMSPNGTWPKITRPNITWRCMARQGALCSGALMTLATCAAPQQRANVDAPITTKHTITATPLHVENAQYKKDVSSRYEHLSGVLPKQLKAPFTWVYADAPGVVFHVNRQGIVRLNTARANSYYLYRLEENALNMGVTRDAYIKFCYIDKQPNAKNLTLHMASAQIGRQYVRRGHIDEALRFYPYPYRKDVFLTYSASGRELILGHKTIVTFSASIAQQDRQAALLLALGASSICTKDVHINT